ncbi:MAG: hypothetical protein KDD78_02310 [Caldilineaceae bacterium]|nr:hypothetical protein [Caldilineaceae bacterium]
MRKILLFLCFVLALAPGMLVLTVDHVDATPSHQVSPQSPLPAGDAAAGTRAAIFRMPAMTLGVDAAVGLLRAAGILCLSLFLFGVAAWRQR